MLAIWRTGEMLLDSEVPTFWPRFNLAFKAVSTLLQSFTDGIDGLINRQRGCEYLVSGVLDQDFGKVG